MKTRTSLVVILIAVIALVTVGWTQVNQKAREPKWQYMSYQVSSTGPTDQEMNKLGWEGWEFVAIDAGENRATRYIFKRKIIV
jgi:hypothetical protein